MSSTRGEEVPEVVTAADRPITLVTGATGTLGREVVAVLVDRGDSWPRLLSRRAAPAELPPGRSWVQADLVHGDLAAAVEGVDAIIHLASGKGIGDEDVISTQRLTAAAHDQGVRHVVVISIIGADHIPLPFYATKVAIEDVVRAQSAPWSIVRVAQFHSFVERLVALPASLPVPAPIIADLCFQPIDEREVAEHLVDIAAGPTHGEAAEIAGPELLTLGQIAATWLSVTGAPARLLPMSLANRVLEPDASPAPESWVVPVLERYRAAWNTPHGRRTLGRVTFEQWLRRKRG